jgi:hypothetical protein
MTIPTHEQLEHVYETTRVDEEKIRQALVRIRPSWRMVESMDQGGVFVRGNIQVLFSLAREDDGRIWIHVSACGRRGPREYFLPTWEEMKRVKNDFLGEDAWAYQVFPSQKLYVNQNPYVLHLFALLDNRPALPDFTRGLGTL